MADSNPNVGYQSPRCSGAADTAIGTRHWEAVGCTMRADQPRSGSPARLGRSSDRSWKICSSCSPVGRSHQGVDGTLSSRSVCIARSHMPAPASPVGVGFHVLASPMVRLCRAGLECTNDEVTRSDAVELSALIRLTSRFAVTELALGLSVCISAEDFVVFVWHLVPRLPSSGTAASCCFAFDSTPWTMVNGLTHPSGCVRIAHQAGSRNGWESPPGVSRAPDSMRHSLIDFALVAAAGRRDCGGAGRVSRYAAAAHF